MALIAENVRFSYPVFSQAASSGSPILWDFSATFERATITAVTGSNGCGKTTLAKLLTGMLRPSTGEVLVDDECIASLTLTEVGRRVGLVMQNPERQMYCTSVREEIEFGLRNFGFPNDEIQARRDHYLEVFALSPCIDRFPFELSGGEKQRLMLAAVLATGPSYLVLDEPTSALDRGRRRVLGELLVRLAVQEDIGVVLISHDERFIKDYADKRIAMSRP